MYMIGENIHIISPKVKQALADRDGAFFVDLARKQKAAGAHALDLNIGPQKKAGPEVMDWLVDCMQEAVRDMTPLVRHDQPGRHRGRAEERRIGHANAIINSTSAEEERLANVPPLAAQVRREADRPVHGEERHPGQRRRPRGHRHGEADPARPGSGPADGEPAHRPAGAHRLRLPGIRAAVRSRPCACSRWWPTRRR